MAAEQKEFLGRGIKFPVKVDRMTGVFEMSEYEQDIREAIMIILMTRKGERMMRPEFGCNIHKYAFAVMDYTNIQLMKSEVKEALIMWEPRIKDVEAQITEDKEEEGKLFIQLGYTVRMTNNMHNLVFPYYINEGTAGHK